MTAKEQKLYDLLTEKGYKVKSVMFYSTFGYLPDGGWIADLEDGEELNLGKKYEDAIRNIENS